MILGWQEWFSIIVHVHDFTFTCVSRIMVQQKSGWCWWGMGLYHVHDHVTSCGCGGPANHDAPSCKILWTWCNKPTSSAGAGGQGVMGDGDDEDHVACGDHVQSSHACFHLWEWMEKWVLLLLLVLIEDFCILMVLLSPDVLVLVLVLVLLVELLLQMQEVDDNSSHDPYPYACLGFHWSPHQWNKNWCKWAIGFDTWWCMKM